MLEKADLATEQKRQLRTGKRTERTKRDFQCPICHSAIGQASFLFLNQPNISNVGGLLLPPTHVLHILAHLLTTFAQVTNTL